MTDTDGISRYYHCSAGIIFTVDLSFLNINKAIISASFNKYAATRPLICNTDMPIYAAALKECSSSFNIFRAIK